MKPEALIAAITEALQSDPRLRGLFLSGSHGRGTADAFSDIDLLAILNQPDIDGFAADWQATLEAILPVVFWNRIDGPAPVLNAIAEDWTRVDIHVGAAAVLKYKSQDGLRPLIDRNGLHRTLQPTLPIPAPDARRINYLVNEFIRVLGLLPVVAGREEWLVGITGAGLLRGMLVTLMIEENAIPDPGGALHLTRNTSAAQQAVLADVPAVLANRTSVLDANRALALAFFPAARRLAAKAGVAWPDRFEAATRAGLVRAFGDDTPWPASENARLH